MDCLRKKLDELKINLSKYDSFDYIDNDFTLQDKSVCLSMLIDIFYLLKYSLFFQVLLY